MSGGSPVATGPVAAKKRPIPRSSPSRGNEGARPDASFALASAAGNRALQASSGGLRTLWLRGEVVFLFNQGPRGFAVSRWALGVQEPPDGLTEAERRGVNDVVTLAVFESQSRHIHVFEGERPARALTVPLRFPLGDLRDERARGLLASRIGDHLRAAIESARNVERERWRQQRSRLLAAPLGDEPIERATQRQVASLREEIARMRRDMRAGEAEQALATRKLSQFAALMARSPEPDISRWQSAEPYLRQAEQALDDRDPHGADLFMNVARVSLKSQQDWWRRYKRDYDFGDEVLAPVFWQAFSLFSMGIVDESLFDEFDAASRQEWPQQLWIIVSTLVARVGNVITFGGYEGWKAGVEKRIRKAPDEPLWKAMLAATPDAVQGVIDTMLPLQEAATLAGRGPVDPATGRTTTPDIWAKVQAFFSALLKLAVLRGMAKGRGGPRAGEPRVGAPEGYGDRTAGSMKETQSTPESRAAMEKMQYGEFEPADLGAEPEPAPKSEAAPKAEPKVEPKSARAPEREGVPSEKGKKGGKASPEEVIVPDSHPNVLLVGVTETQFRSLLAELKNSTDAGREIARRIDSGELHITLDVEGFTREVSGLAIPKEVHVKWGASLQETASTTIHEGVHQADPQLSGGGSRAEIEARARVAEYEYRALRGLEPYDTPEAAYRAILEQAARDGMPRDAALERARAIMIDMMRVDPARYGVEAAGEGAKGAPAKAPARVAESGASTPKAMSKAKLVAQLERLKLPQYLMRQLRAQGETAMREYLAASKERRQAIAKRLKLQDEGERSMKKDKDKAKPSDPFEERIPTRPPTAEELMRDPSAAEIIERADEPQGTFEKGEAQRIGVLEEKAEIRELIPDLQAEGYTDFFLKADFSKVPWLRKIFSGNEKPDFIALDAQGKRILVGDTTSSLRTEVPDKLGTGKRAHFEKTRDDYAKPLLDKLGQNPDFRGYEVWAKDFLRNTWEQMEPVFIGVVGG